MFEYMQNPHLYEHIFAIPSLNETKYYQQLENTFIAKLRIR